VDVESLISSHVRDLEPYEPPDWQDLAARAGIPAERLIRLDANESPYGPSPRVLEALARFKGYGLYPDYRPLEAAVARYVGAEPEEIVLGNGGDEIIDLAVRLFLEPGEGAIVCPPAFEMYAVNSRAHRGHVLNVPRRDDFSLDVEGVEALLAERGTEVRPKLLFVASPGNPDGLVVPHSTIRRVLDLPLAVVVDEAYAEFGGESLIPLLARHPNLIVARTFSKWAGVAGLRLGYAVTAPQIARAMARLRPPYNVNAAAVVAALATFEDMDRVRATIGRIIAERDRLYQMLDGLPGVRPLPSRANFVFCWLKDRSGQEVADALAERGILVRAFSGESGEPQERQDRGPSLVKALRITVGRPEENDTVVAAMRTILGVTQAGDDPRPAPPAVAPGRSDRRATLHRQTRETEVDVSLDLDGTGSYEIDTGLGFLDHMLAQVALHGLFELSIQARGDLEVDEHHTVEDVAIALGQALDAALGDRQGLVRMAHAYVPLDEALARVVVDLSGRPYAAIEATFAGPRIGTVGTDLIVHFLETLAVHARLSLHARVLYGRNDHHKAEALFKALGRALDAATRRDPRREGAASTKGVL
jgi:histidinol-phosphate aminotransferase